MILYEILLPVQDNSHQDMAAAHELFRAFLVDENGGYTMGRIQTGAWCNELGVVMYDYMVPYRVACDAVAWRKIVASAFDLFPDQLAIFHAKIGEATIEERPAPPMVLPVNDLAAIDHAAYKEKFYYD
jgi:hypothetical protein